MPAGVSMVDIDHETAIRGRAVAAMKRKLEVDE